MKLIWDNLSATKFVCVLSGECGFDFGQYKVEILSDNVNGATLDANCLLLKSIFYNLKNGEVIKSKYHDID